MIVQNVRDQEINVTLKIFNFNNKLEIVRLD